MTPSGLARLKQDEGYATELINGDCEAYPDPNSPLAVAQRLPLSKRPKGWAGLSGEPYTCGFGETKGVTKDTRWTRSEAEARLADSISDTERRLAAALPWITRLDPVRADVLTNIAFNVGVAELLHWTTTLAHVKAGDYDAAADDLLHEGKWNRDVGARAIRLAHAMRIGAW